MTTYYRQARAWMSAHKFYSTIIIIALLSGVYYAYAQATAPSTAPQYTTSIVASSTVVASMSETGQVSATSNISVESQAGGEVFSVPVVPGEHVNAGATLATIDPTTAEEGVESAKEDLQAAQIALAQLEEPAATSTLTQQQNAVASAETNLNQAHQSSYNDVSSAFLDLPTVISGLDTILHGQTVPGRTYEENENAYADIVSPYDPTVTNYEATAEADYQTAYASYKTTLADFNATSRDASDADIESLTQEAYQTAGSVSDALKSTTDFLNFVNTTLTDRNLSVPSTLPTQLTTLASYTTETNTHVAALSGDTDSIASDEGALTAAQATLSQTQAGPDSLSVQSSQLSIQEKEQALATAEQSLADTDVTAPFSGTVASLAIQQYQTVGNGAAIATLVSDNQSVDISVNEVDAAKLQVGQKATLTFDALPGVTIAGTVSQVDTIGTVTQGVVSYDAVITFDTPNSEVKPGMSATANIITGTETGLAVPTAAIKTLGVTSYVQVFSPPISGKTSTTPPTDAPITTGLAGTIETIVESGLSPGEQIVISTTQSGTAATAKSTAAQSTSVFGAGAGGRGGGAAVRGL